MLLEQLLVRALYISARNLEPALVPYEADALRTRVVVQVGTLLHDDAVGVLHGSPLSTIVPLGYELYGTKSVHANGSLCYVVHVGTPVGRIAVARLLVPSPCSPQLLVLLGVEADGRAEVGMIVYLGVVERTHPEIPVQVLGYGHLRQVERLWRVSHTAVYLLDVAYATRAYQGYSLLELLAAALLRAHLQDAVVVPYGSLHRQSLGNGVSQGLLEVHVLASLQRVDGNEGMPMVGSGNLYGIDVLALEHALVLLVHVATLGHALFLLPCRHVTAETLALDAVHVAAGSHLHAGATGERAEVAASLLTYSHEAKHYPVARGNPDSVHSEAWQDHEACNARGGRRQELAPADAWLVGHVFFLCRLCCLGNLRMRPAMLVRLEENVFFHSCLVLELLFVRKYLPTRGKLLTGMSRYSMYDASASTQRVFSASLYASGHPSGTR